MTTAEVDAVARAQRFAELALAVLDYARLPGPPECARYIVKLEDGQEFVVAVECVP